MFILWYASLLVDFSTAYECTEVIPLVCDGDDQVALVTASSTHSQRLRTSSSCLDQLRSQNSAGSWAAKVLDSNQWIQADLRSESVVKSVATQGREGLDQWVTAYKVLYSDDAVTWKAFLSGNGAIKIFNGNTDRSTKVTNDLPYAVKTRYVRLLIHSWYRHISMRWNIMGCHTDDASCGTNACENNGICRTEFSFRCYCPVPYTGRHCSDADEEDTEEEHGTSSWSESSTCQSNPCRNGGICRDTFVHRCYCPSPYTGSNCSEEINQPRGNPTTNSEVTAENKNKVAVGAVIGTAVVCALLPVVVLSIVVYICKKHAIGCFKEQADMSVKYEIPDKGMENPTHSAVYQDITESGNQ